MYSYLVVYQYPYLLLHVWMYAYGSSLIFVWPPMGRSKEYSWTIPGKPGSRVFLYIRTDFCCFGLFSILIYSSIIFP